jgi:hypothetical protein
MTLEKPAMIKTDDSVPIGATVQVCGASQKDCSGGQE